MSYKQGYPPQYPPQNPGQYPGQPAYASAPADGNPPPYELHANPNVYTQPRMPPAGAPYGYYQTAGIPIPPGTQVIYVNEMGQPINNQRDHTADDCCMWAMFGMLCCCCMNALN